MATNTENKTPTYKGDPNSASFFLVSSKEDDKDVSKINPFVITKTLNGHIGEPEQVKLLRKKILVEVKKSSQVKNLLKLNKIGDVKVEVTPHPTLNSTRGIIRDRANVLSVCTEDEIIEGLKDQGVSAVRRFKTSRNGEVKETNTYQLTFDRPELPKEIKVCYHLIKVQTYYPSPLRCFKCQQFGHHKDRCSKNPACLNCAQEGHEKKDCKNDPHCANCEGAHAANSPLCPRWKAEKEIVKIKVDEKITMGEARKRVLPSYISSPTYASAAAVQEHHTTESLLKILKDVGVETKRELIKALLMDVKSEEEKKKAALQKQVGQGQQEPQQPKQQVQEAAKQLQPEQPHKQQQKQKTTPPKPNNIPPNQPRSCGNVSMVPYVSDAAPAAHSTPSAQVRSPAASPEGKPDAKRGRRANKPELNTGTKCAPTGRISKPNRSPIKGPQK